MARKKDVAPALWAHDQSFEMSAVLCGIDEVGRGPLAGNVVAACVILDLSLPPITGLNDSKKLSPEMREALFPIILQQALAWGIGEATPEEIDRLNILNATFLAMRRALDSLPKRPAFLLVDGNQTIPGVSIPQKTLVGGDGVSASIAAASVLAKVTRDRSMMAWDQKFPEYGFASHKGYGTAEHREALGQHGVSPIHRHSFCSAFLT